MAAGFNIYRRHSVYWWRRRVPVGLRSLFPSPELRCSLRTHVRSEATTRAARIRVVTDVAFQEMERAVQDAATLTPETMQQIVQAVVQQELDQCEREREQAGPRGEADVQQAVAQHQARRAQLQQALRFNRFDGLDPVLEPHLAGVGDQVGESDLAALRRRTARALTQASLINEKREYGIYDETPDVAAPRFGDAWNGLTTPAAAGPAWTAASASPVLAAPQAPAPQSPSRVSSSSTDVRSDVPAGSAAAPDVAKPTPGPDDVDLSDYPPSKPISEDVRAKLARLPLTKLGAFYIARESDADMKRKFRVAIRLLSETAGDVPVGEIRRQDVIEALTLMLRLPKYHGKGAESRRPLPELVDLADRQEASHIDEIEGRLAAGQIDRKTAELQKQKAQTKRVSPDHVMDNHRPRLNTFLDWCFNEGLTGYWIEIRTRDVPRVERLAAEERHVALKRLPWEADGLKRLFLSSIFSKPRDNADDPLFWAPLIAVHQSTREEEVLQLRVSDFEKKDGVWVVHLRDGYAKHHKTPASERTIPLHQFVIMAGLLDLVERRRAEDGDDAWLFKSIDLGHDGKFSSVFTKAFTRYRQKEGIYDPCRDFHSLRKDFNSMLARAGIKWASRKRLMGHVITDLTEGAYDPCGEPLDARAEYVNCIDLGLEVAWVEGCAVLRERPDCPPDP